MLSAFLAPTNTHTHTLTHTLNQRALSGKQMSVVILCQCRPVLLCSAPFTKKTRTKQKPLRTNYQSCLFVCKFFQGGHGRMGVVGHVLASNCTFQLDQLADPFPECFNVFVSFLFQHGESQE